MDQIWYSSDTHLILASVSCVSNEYQTRIKRVFMRISLILIEYQKSHGGQLPPMRFLSIKCVSGVKNLILIWYAFDTHLILASVSCVSNEYQMSIRWVSDEYQMFCNTESMVGMILMILIKMYDIHDAHDIHMVLVWYACVPNIRIFVTFLTIIIALLTCLISK